MKPFLLLAVATLTLSGCAGGTKCDTGDSACGGSNEDLLIQSMDGDCSGGMCTWQVEVNGEFGRVELDLVETGDPGWECGPASTKGDLVCGAWSEYHYDFVTSDFNNPGEDPYEIKSINLTLEDSYRDQVNNVSTIFDVSNSTISNQLTILFTVYDASDNYLDCAKYGHDTSYFDCPNDANTW